MDDSTPENTTSSRPQAAPGAETVPLGQTVYLAADGFLDDLVAELGDVASVDGRLVFADGPARPAAWAQNIWHDPVRIEFASIKGGAKALRGIQRNWALWSQRHHRRAALIQENLPHVSAKPVVFPSPLPTAPLGSWTLLDESTIIAAARCSSPFRNGEVTFVENRTAPPNRAYLKLWEALTLFGEQPGPGDRCLDLGACPGGWTWVLHELGRVGGQRRQGAARPSHRRAAAGADPPGKCLRAEAAGCRAGGLAVLRRDLLPDAAVAAGAGVDGQRAGQALRLHAEVPGRDRP